MFSRAKGDRSTFDGWSPWGWQGGLGGMGPGTNRVNQVVDQVLAEGCGPSTGNDGCNALEELME